jgi:hypothetical protein
LITTAIAMPFAVAAQRMSWMHQGLVTGSGLLSLGCSLLTNWVSSITYSVPFRSGRRIDVTAER